MNEHFEDVFWENGAPYYFSLAPWQASELYSDLGHRYQSEDAVCFNITFNDEDRITGRPTVRTFKQDPASTFAFYQRLETWIQQHRQDNGFQIHHLQEANF